MFATMTSLASDYALPLALTVGTTIVSAAAKRLWSSEPINSEIDKSVSEVRDSVLLGSQTSSRELDHVESDIGHTGVESLLTAEIGPTTILTAENPRVTTVVTAENQDVREAEDLPKDGMLFVRVPQIDEEFDEEHIEKYLSAGKAQMVFSTAAMQGEGFSRSVDLMKKEGDQDVADDERQKKVDTQFAKIKHLLGVGGRDGMPNKAIRYSVTWHFVEVYNRAGEPPVKYDLVDKADIKRLLEDQGIDNVDDEMVDTVFTKLLSINREIKSLTKREVGKTKDCFLHDYIGNPNGLGLFSPSSIQDQRLKNSSKHGKYDSTLMNLGLARKGSGILGSKKLTANGAKAFNHIEETRCLQLLARHMLSSRAEKIQSELKTLQSQEATEENIQKIQTLNTEFQDVKNAYSEIENANETAIDFTSMELSRELTHTESRWNAQKNRFEGKEFTKPAQWFLGPFQDQNRLDVLGPANENNEQAALGKTRQRRFTLARHIANDYVFMLSTESKSGWISRKHYAPTKADKQQAVEIGSLIYHLTGDESRLDLVQDQQALGRKAFTRKVSEDSDSRVEDPVGSKVFREPRAEKFLLNGTLNMSRDAAPSEEHLLGYRGASSVVQQELAAALTLFQSCRGRLQVHQEGEGLHVKKLGDLGIKVAQSLIA
jgi:hypothetical protein